jgi:hypothetical protein
MVSIKSKTGIAAKRRKMLRSLMQMLSFSEEVKEGKKKH